MTPPCVVPTFRPYTVENLEFGGFYVSSCESRANRAGVIAYSHHLLLTGFLTRARGCLRISSLPRHANRDSRAESPFFLFNRY